MAALFWLAVLAYLGVLAWRGTIRTFWPLPDWNAAHRRKLQRDARKAKARRKRHAADTASTLPPEAVPYDVSTDLPPGIVKAVLGPAEADRLAAIGRLLDGCPHKADLPTVGPYRCPCGITWYPERRTYRP